MKPRILKAVPTYVPRKREGMSALHLVHIRLLPCLICGEGGKWMTSDPHHLMRLLPPDPGKRGMSLKSADRWTVPVCRKHHLEVTDANDDEWFAARGIDARAVAAALWSERDQGIDALRRIIDRARQMAALKLRG